MEDRRILEQFPLPLARGYRRYLNAPESKERHDLGYFLFEIYLKYLSATAIAAYLASPERDHRVNAALKGLLRPSLGEWLRFLRECLEFAGRREDSDPVTRSIVALFKEKDARAPRCLHLFNQMRSFRTDQRSEKEAMNLGGFLEELVAFRNRALGHGAPLDREHYRAFGDLFGPAFAELLDRSPFLTARRLVSFDSTRVEEGSWVECAVIEFMGNQPVRRQKPHRVRYGDPVPTENLLYLLSDMVSGESAGLLALDPLLVAHREDVYVLNDAQGAPEYLSYSTGEHHRPSDLGGKQGELFEKILGYRVDETRMSQMGDELASSTEKAASLDLKDGEKRFGDYRILREVGRGAMGTVFEAFQESLGRRVALKMLPGNFSLDQRRLERFRREARATARIHHASIVPVYEVGEAAGTHYYAMEFIDGPSLDKLLEDARKIASGGPARKSSTSDPAYIAAAVEQIAALAEGLHQAHHLGLIHRDVKPSNILVDSSGGYVLVDFGLVHEEEAGTLTRSGELVGTLSYMSPEQLSRRQVDARSDVYSLGATLYEVLTLRPPFGGESDHQIQNGILFEEPVPPRRLNPRLNRDLETIVLHALEKNPERRYASAAELAADLRRFIRYEPIRARPISIFGRLARHAGRHRTALAAGAVILVLLTSLGGLLLKSRGEERARLLSEYEPRVTRAVMKTQLGRLGQLSGTGDALPFSAERPPGIEEIRAGGRGAGLETLEEALRELDAAVALAPERPDAHFHRANVLLLINRVPEAEAALDRALECDPSFVPARVLRAELLRRSGDAEGARRETAAAESSPGEEWARAWLSAHQAVLERDWGKAVEAYTALIETGTGREPYLGSDIEARLGRALAYLEGDEFHRAIQDLVAARTLWPEAPEPQLLLGKAYYLKGEDAAAEETFRELHRRSPFPDQAALAVAAVYASAENREAALEWVEARVKSQLERERGRSLYLNGLDRPEEAEKAARVAVGLKPGDIVSLRNLGWALEKQEKHREQVQLFREAMEKNPEDPDLRELLVWALFANRDLDAAEAVCRGGLGLHGRNPRLMTVLGRVLSGQGKAEAAIEQFQKAIQVDPTDYSPYGAWQEVLSRSQRHKEAAEKIHEYLRANPHVLPSSWLFVDLALIYAQLEDHARAFVAWSELIERHGDHWALGSLASSLRLADATPEVIACMDRLITKLERVPEPRRTVRLLNALAALFLYHPQKRNAAKALDYASSAIRRAKVKHPELLATLAEAKFLTGEKNEAVAILEDAAGLPGAGQLVTGRLKDYFSQIPGVPPQTPGNLEPPHATSGLTPPVLLAASPFGHPDHDVQHLKSRWQLRHAGEGDRTLPAIEHVSKTDRESWAVPEGLLLPRTTYSWRVSYTGSNLRSSSPSAETSFRTADFPWETAPFDLSGQFNRDVVADPGDGQDDSLDSGGGLLVVEEFDGKPAEKTRVQGLPGDRRIGIHVLGDYAGKNAVQLSSLNRGSVRIPVPQGSYSAVRFLVTGGHGDSLVPLVLEYADGTTEETSLPCDDWFDDSPAEGKTETVGVLQPGVVPALDGMDRNFGGFFQDSNDPAIFEVFRVARPDKVLRALLLEPGRGLFTQMTGAPTRFNLLAATGIRAIGK